MLRNPRGATSLRWLEVAARRRHRGPRPGRRLCPGVNDGAVLERTLCGVLERYPALASLGVGAARASAATRRRPRCAPHTRAEAGGVVDARRGVAGRLRARPSGAGSSTPRTSTTCVAGRAAPGARATTARPGRERHRHVGARSPRAFERRRGALVGAARLLPVRRRRARRSGTAHRTAASRPGTATDRAADGVVVAHRRVRRAAPRRPARRARARRRRGRRGREPLLRRQHRRRGSALPAPTSPGDRARRRRRRPTCCPTSCLSDGRFLDGAGARRRSTRDVRAWSRPTAPRSAASSRPSRRADSVSGRDRASPAPSSSPAAPTSASRRSSTGSSAGASPSSRSSPG